MTKQSLFQLLADNQIEKLIHELKTTNGKYINDLVLLESQWSHLRTKERNGTISSEQANLEVARIRKNLLELIERSFSIQAEIARPFIKPIPSSNRSWVLLAAISITVVAIIFVFTTRSSNDSKSVESDFVKSSQPATLKSSGIAQKADVQARMLEVPTNAMTFNKGKVGDITYKFLSAELSELNMDSWLLRLKVRGIKPAYGFRISGSNLHISFGDLEKSPVNNSFEFINAGETADGVVEFEIPKEYNEAKLLIYHYVDEAPLATIPFKW